jgi:hypothetical protein
MTKTLEKYRGAPIQKLNEFMEPLPSGDGDTDKAARHILRTCRLSEHTQGDDQPLIFLVKQAKRISTVD